MRRIICIILWHLGLRGAAYKVSPAVAMYLYGKEIQEELDGWRVAWKVKEMQWRTGR
jgi:hypothetical protein